MDITINLATSEFIRSPKNRTAVKSLRFKRGDTSALRVFFVDGDSSVPVQLPEGTTGRFGLKKHGKYGDGFVVNTTSWTPVEDDGLYYYVFEPNFNTVQLNDILDALALRGKGSVTLMGEIQWISDGAISSSVTFDAVVDNDVIQGDESVPTDANPPYPTPDEIALKTYVDGLLGALFAVGSLTIDADGTSTVTKASPAEKQRTTHCDIQAGTGPYSHTIVIDDADCNPGDISTFVLAFAASTNPEITIDGGSDTVTLSGDGSGASRVVYFVFTNGAWQHRETR